MKNYLSNLTTKRPGTGDFPANKIYDLIKQDQQKRLLKKTN